MQQEKDDDPKIRLALALSFSRMPDEGLEGDYESTSPVATGSPQEISAAERPWELDNGNLPVEEEVDFGSEDFEFSFVCREPETISADQIFSNGQIRPVYPVFNRDVYLFQGGDGGGGEEENEDGSSTSSSCVEKVVRVPLGKLFIEDRDPLSCSSSESDDLEGLPEDSYCVWNPRSMPPSPDVRKKINSTGSYRRWRLRDLVGRSQSDGKDKFLFLATPAHRARTSDKKSPEREKKSPEKEKKLSGRSPDLNPDDNSAAAGEEVKKGKGKGKGGVRFSEMDMVAAHRFFYGKGGGDGDRRRSFLPYRKDLVGFFGNVTGGSRGCPSS